MILPNSDISIMDVRNALGYPSTDLGTLCSCDKINMWAKYKPVPYNFTTNRPSEWWRGQTRECGIKVDYQQIGSESLLQQVKQKIIDGYEFFKPMYPKGGVSEPFRLGDFAGYNSNATHNVVNISVPDSAGWNNGSGIDNAARVTMAVQWRHDDSMLSLSDLRVNEGVFNLAEWYLGAILNIPADKESARIVTNDTPLADMENVDWIEFNVGGTGTITIYPVLCQQSNTTLSTYLGGYVIPLPNLGSYECQIIEGQRAQLSFNENNSSVTNLTNEYRVTFSVTYSDVATIPTDIPGKIKVALSTQYGQPLSDFVEMPDKYSIVINSANGTYTFNSFVVNKSSFNYDPNDSNVQGLLVVFTPDYIYYGNTVYGVITI